MPVRILIGTQLGDEGKGKMVDYFAKDADLAVRYQGGDNAGHTVINEFGVFKLHLIPCGIFYKDCLCLIGTGVVLNPDCLIEEMEHIQKAGLSLEKLRVSDRAQLIMPYHVMMDELMEKSGGIGTTKRGIGQAYASKMLRNNLRAGDLRDLNKTRDILDSQLGFVNAQLAYFGAKSVTLEQLMVKCEQWKAVLEPMLIDANRQIHEYIDLDKSILFEGQLGVMKDIDIGTYPYVTASNPVAAYAAVSAGFSPKHINCVTGVAKAFSSAVGSGPFPTEMPDDDARRLRGSGERPDDEYGARTGRARRLGWLDIPVLKYAHWVNGLDELVVTKIDKLDTLDKILVCTGYKLNGNEIDYMPDTESLYKAEPIYTEMEGWMSDTSECKDFDDLPVKAKEYVKFIEKSVGVPVKYIGNGPERENVIQVSGN